MRAGFLAAAVLAAWSPSLAQSSASFQLEEHALNAGGRPAQAIVASSASFRITLDSIGGPMAGRGYAGGAFRLDSGFDSAYAPPGEVRGLTFLGDHQTLTWQAERASTSYDVYSAPLSDLPGSFGGCAQSDVPGTSWSDPSVPPSGIGSFYLVTGKNRLREEGTKGATSAGAPRANPAPCP